MRWRPPAGENTREARVVAVSRLALAARINHGVPLSDLVEHFTALTAAEQCLLTEQKVNA
jgi:hypothetical protein